MKKQSDFKKLEFNAYNTKYEVTQIQVGHYQTPESPLAIILVNENFDWKKEDDIDEVILTTNIGHNFIYQENEVTINRTEFNSEIIDYLVKEGYLLPTDKVGYSGYNTYEVYTINFEVENYVS